MTTVRSATPADARSIATIHVECWQAAYRGMVPDPFLDSLFVDIRETAWRQNLQEGNAPAWVAQESDAIVRWISAAASRDADAQSTGEIWAVYVAPEHRGKGIGRLLCETAERHLSLEGFLEVTLWVLEDNHRAVKSYRSVGIHLDVDSRKTIERGGKSLVEVRFRKPLPP